MQTELLECKKALEETINAHNTLKKKAAQLKGVYQQATADLKISRENENALKLR